VLSPSEVEAAPPQGGYQPAAPRALIEATQRDTGELSQAQLPPEMRLPPHVWAQLGRDRQQALIAQAATDYTNPAEAALKWGGRQAMNLGRFAYEHVPGLETYANLVTSMSGRNLRDDLGLAREETTLADLATGDDTYAKRQAKMPRYGAATPYLEPTNTAERVGSGLLDATSMLALGPSRAATTQALRQVPGVGRVIDTVANAAPRIANRVGAALHEGAVGGLFGLAQNDDPVGGSVFGTVAGAALPGTTAGFERSMLEAAEKNIGRVLSPTKEPNKRWVRQNWQEFARTSPWLSGIRNLGERAEYLADQAGRAIDRVLTGVRQGNVAPQLRAARSSIQRAANMLLAQGPDVGVILAPEARAELQAVARGLDRLNPESTSLAILQDARDVVQRNMRTLRQQLADRAQQVAGMGQVEDVFQLAVQSQSRNARRAGRRATRALDDLVSTLDPTRIQTRPILARLDAFRRTFIKTSDETGEPIVHNQAAVDAIDGLINQVARHGRDMSVNDVRDVRKIWDDLVAGAKGKGWMTDMAEGSRQGAQREAANALRGNIAQKVPDIVQPNRAFSFNTNLRDVVEDTLTRQTGQTHGLVESLVGGGGAVATLVSTVFKGGAAGLMTALPAAVLYGATRLVKRPEFNLLAAKTRLALLDALRNRNVDAIRDILSRTMAQESAQASQGFRTSDADRTNRDLTREEAETFRQQLQEGKPLPPGLTDPDVQPEDAYDAANDAALDEPDPTGTRDAEDDADLLFGPTGEGDETGGEPEARTGPPGAPETLQAGVGGGAAQSVLDFLDPVTKPRLSLPRYGDEHPNWNRLMEAIEYNSSLSDAANLVTSVARPLSAATRLAKPIERVDRALGGLQTLQGLATAQRGLEARDPGMVLGGTVGATMGGLSMRPNRVGPGGEVEVPGLGRRLLQGATAGGVAAAAGPAVLLTAQALANSPELIKAIPDENLRNTIAQGLITLGMAKGGASFAALAYLHAPPSRKAKIHLVGDLSEGKSAALARQQLLPLLEKEILAEPSKALRQFLVNNGPDAARAEVRRLAMARLDELEAEARPLQQQVDADSGRQASDVGRAERVLRTEQGLHMGWYDKTRALAQRQVPKEKGDVVGENGLTAKQHFSLEAMAAFGTNTPPIDNYKLYKIVADVVREAPAGLDRQGLMTWLQGQITQDTKWVKGRKGREQRRVERVFGMDAQKPGIPALRSLIEGRSESLGGRKIESYFHNLGGIQRENPIGTLIDPVTIDRWMLRYFGLPTEAILKTETPVLQRGPGGAPIELPATYRTDQVARATSAVTAREQQLAQAKDDVAALEAEGAPPATLRQAQQRVEQRQSLLVEAQSKLDQAQRLATPEGGEEGAAPSPLLLRGEHGGSVRYEPETKAKDAKRYKQIRAAMMAEAQAKADARYAKMQKHAEESAAAGRALGPLRLAAIERAGKIGPREQRRIDAEARRRSLIETPIAKQQSENRKTSAGSAYMGQGTIADAAYEVTERTITEAARRAGVHPKDVQSVLWFTKKFGSDLFGGARPTQGLSLDQQKTLVEAQEGRLAPYAKDVSTALSRKKGQPQRVGPITPEQHRKLAEKQLRARDLKLAKEIQKSIVANGGATFTQGTKTVPGADKFGSDLTAVSIFPRRTENFPPEIARRSGKLGFAPSIVGFMNNNADLLRDPRYAIGGWRYNGRTAAQRRAGVPPLTFGGREVPAGTLVLDIVATASREDNNLIAKTLGLDYNQYAVFELLGPKGTEIPTLGTSYGPSSPASRNAARAGRPSPYAMGGELTLAAAQARAKRQLRDPRLTGEQKAAVQRWLSEARAAAQAGTAIPAPPAAIEAP
jgi:hypothetical protein